MNWQAEHLADYLESGGARGHVLDVGQPLVTHCLIRVRGRRTGRVLVTPLIYGTFGGEVVICASNGGAERHPDWYFNLVAGDEVELQIATQAFRAAWREPVGVERERVWRFMVDVFPKYGSYQAGIARQIPLVMLKVLAQIAVFQPG